MFDFLTIRILSVLAVLAVVVCWVILPYNSRKELYRVKPAWTTSDDGRTRAWTTFRDVLIGASFLLVLSVILVPEFLLNGPLELSFQLDVFVQIVGFALAVMGALLGGLAIKALGRYGTEKVGVMKGHELVQSGPYHYARHPVYGATLLIGLGFFLLYLNLAFLILLVPVFLVNVYRANAEERILSSPEGFGERYGEYARKTKRFVPFLF